MQHLDEGILQAWLDRPRSGLDPSEIAEIERHLESCEACASALETLGESSGRTQSLLAMGVDRDMPRPSFEEVFERARGRGSAANPRLRLNRMAWAASVAVAIGVGWMTNEMIRSGVPAGPARFEEALEGPTRDVDPADDVPDAAVSSPRRADEAEPSPPRPSAVGRLQVGVEEARLRQAAPLPEAETVAEPAPAPQELFADADARAPVAAREALPDAGQTIISGVVRDANGEPVSAAQVYVGDIEVGALSQQDGSYMLVLPASESDSAQIDVVATRIGFRTDTQKIAVGGRADVVADFRLDEEALQLQEVVVTGVAGGTQRRAVGNAVARLTGSPFVWRAGTREAVEAVLGRAILTVPGLEVLSVESSQAEPPGEGPVVRVRQDLDGATVITLVQGTSDASREAWPMESDGSLQSTRVGELLVTGTAAVSADSLRALLDALR